VGKFLDMAREVGSADGLGRVNSATSHQPSAVNSSKSDKCARAPLASDHTDNFDKLSQAEGWRSLVATHPAVVAEIVRIERIAMAVGWTEERLWRHTFWPHCQDHPRGLASIMSDGDIIGAVTADYIEIRRTKRSVLRFMRRAS
jgi:hypothetical protein